MDTKISTTVAIALARALSSGSTGSPGSAARSAMAYGEVSAAWVGTRMPAAVSSKVAEDVRTTRDERSVMDTLADPEGFVAGTLGMVTFARSHTQDLAEYPADRDTVL
jgi:hypothetical protein